MGWLKRTIGTVFGGGRNDAGAAASAPEQFGPHSPQYASAAHDVWPVLLDVNQRERAVAAMREAAATRRPPSPTPSATSSWGACRRTC